MKCFLIFEKVFYAKFVPKITIRESFCQKIRDFLISRKFLLVKFLPLKYFSKRYVKYAKYGFSVIRIFPYKDRSVDFVLIQENTGQWKSTYSDFFYAAKTFQ